MTIPNVDFSARKFMVIVTVGTYCLSILGSLVLCIMGKLAVDVFLALFAGLGTLVMYIIKAYFDDKARPEETGGGAK